MHLPKITRTAALLSVALVARGAAQANWKPQITEQAQTEQGLLQIETVGLGGYRLTVDGKSIAEIEAYSIGIDRPIPFVEPAQYVLLKIEKGGGSCGTLYRLVDLTPGKKAFLTEEFGNCTTEPVLGKRGENVAIDFPDAAGFKARSFTYDTVRRRLRRNL